MNICDDDDFCVFLTIFVRAEDDDDDVSICPDERERERKCFRVCERAVSKRVVYLK